MVHKADMIYTGSFLNWYGVGRFPASSGLSVKIEEEQLRDQGKAGPPLDPQFARFQTLPDQGPIPAGLYSFPLVVAGEAKFRVVGNVLKLDTREGIEHLPHQWVVHGTAYHNEGWGSDRIRLTIEHIDDPEARKARTGGFYLHDSTKGFSHGCVEVDKNFFIRLRALVRRGQTGRLYLRVKYSSPDVRTQARHL